MEKKKASTEEILEVVIAIFLGITAVLTAWASWIGALHGGNQATSYTTSNNLSAEGNSMWNDASQSLMQDMILWNSISELRIDYTFAQDNGETAEADRLGWKIDKLVSDNCSDELVDAISWADEQEEDVSPFDKEGFIESYYTDAQAKLDEAAAMLEQGKKANDYGDAYGLVSVIYAVVLFLLGIASMFKKLSNRFIVVGIAAVGFIFATIYMTTLPLPEGFSILSYIAGG
jgi:hypothetical protein